MGTPAEIITKATSLVVRSDEESVTFTLERSDGSDTHIGNFNHDEHGWHAMETAGNALEKLAEALHIPIVHRSVYDADE